MPSNSVYQTNQQSVEIIKARESAVSARYGVRYGQMARRLYDNTDQVCVFAHIRKNREAEGDGQYHDCKFRD